MTKTPVMDEAPKHIAEIAEILAVGLMRLRAAKSSELCTEAGESSLDFTATESSHAETTDPEKPA